MHELLGVHSIVTVTVLVVVVSTVLVVFKLTTTIVLVLVFFTLPACPLGKFASFSLSKRTSPSCLGEPMLNSVPAIL